jgi:hypothetical protein
MKSEIETLLPFMAELVTELWSMAVRETGWRDMRTWLSGATAGLSFVSRAAFQPVMDELELLETVCTFHMHTGTAEEGHWEAA